MKYVIPLILFLLIVSGVRAQQNDTLQLSAVIQRVLSMYPSVDQAREALKSAEEKVVMSHSA